MQTRSTDSSTTETSGEGGDPAASSPDSLTWMRVLGLGLTCGQLGSREDGIEGQQKGILQRQT